MAYHFDSYDNALVIDGWDKGIADSPHAGLSDMRNVNIISVPGEASVNFATQLNNSPALTATYTVTGLSSNAISFSGITGLEAGMAIKFTNVGSLVGVSLLTTYWVNVATGNPTTSVTLYSNYLMTTAVTITGSAGGATFTVFNVGTTGVTNAAPQYFVYDNVLSKSYMQDSLGQVWSTSKLTTSGYWTFTGLSGTSDATGCGLTIYGGYVFAFLSSSIDVFSIANQTWAWGWNPSDASVHNNNYLHAVGGVSNGLHEAQVAPDSKVYYCDGNWVCGFYQTDPNVTFVYSTKSTYTFFQQTGLLPITDRAISLSYIGTSILIGGQGNIVYSWDGFSTGATWIMLPEFNVHRIVTVNTNAYLFVGNRGRIYVTNGTGVSLYRKLPDHISGTIEPYFTWGGACSTKNQLYFSALATTNGGAPLTQYGGVWAIDLDSKAMRLTNKLSYGTYGGYATAMAPIFSTNPAGTGLYIGWDDNAFHYGIDITVGTPYTASQASIDSELIPIGTFNKARNVTMVEYKLTKPLVSGESVTINTRLIFNTQDTGYTQTLTDNTVGSFSGTASINFQNAQWVQFQVVLNSTATTPSYTRLKNIRVLGLVGALPTPS